MQPNWSKVTSALSEAFSAISKAVCFKLSDNRLDIIGADLFVVWNGNDYVAGSDNQHAGYEIDSYGEIGVFLPEEYLEMAKIVVVAHAGVLINSAVEAWAEQEALADDHIPY